MTPPRASARTISASHHAKRPRVIETIALDGSNADAAALVLWWRIRGAIEAYLCRVYLLIDRQGRASVVHEEHVMLPMWLREREDHLAGCYARARNGDLPSLVDVTSDVWAWLLEATGNGAAKLATLDRLRRRRPLKRRASVAKEERNEHETRKN